MQGLIESGRAADLILILIAIEAVVLFAIFASTGKGIPPLSTAGILLSGFFLLLALRAALTNAGWMVIAGLLGLAFAAHLFDLFQRWRS